MFAFSVSRDIFSLKKHSGFSPEEYGSVSSCLFVEAVRLITNNAVSKKNRRVILCAPVVSWLWWKIVRHIIKIVNTRFSLPFYRSVCFIWFFPRVYGCDMVFYRCLGSGIGTCIWGFQYQFALNELYTQQTLPSGTSCVSIDLPHPLFICDDRI